MNSFRPFKCFYGWAVLWGAAIIQAGSQSAFFVTLGLAFVSQLLAFIYVILNIRTTRLYKGC